MALKSSRTQERILAVAESLVLKQGFNATGIDDILARASITKSGFFYHFNGKDELAKSLVKRYLKQDDEFFQDLLSRADSLSEDPLQRLLIFLKLLAQAMENLEQVHPGCLVVTFTYENYQLNEEVDQLVKQGILTWRKMIEDRLHLIADTRPPLGESPIEALADYFTVSIEGGILLSRIFQDNRYLAQQISLYREHLRMVFGDLRREP